MKKLEWKRNGFSLTAAFGSVSKSPSISESEAIIFEYQRVWRSELSHSKGVEMLWRGVEVNGFDFVNEMKKKKKKKKKNENEKMKKKRKKKAPKAKTKPRRRKKKE